MLGRASWPRALRRHGRHHAGRGRAAGAADAANGTTLAELVERPTARQTRPSNDTTPQMMETTVRWSDAHTLSDRHNFLVLARHFGIPEEELVLQEGDPS